MYYYCTSTVLRLSNNTIIHGRDLDYLFVQISSLAFKAHYKAGNTLIYTWTQYPAFSGANTWIKSG